MGVFGALGGQPQTMSDGGQLWMQNAGFVWVPFILVATVAAWLGMNDIADASASFAEQSVIFGRKHNWLMCILYTGTFGSFIGYSAGFPLLTQAGLPRGQRAATTCSSARWSARCRRAGTGWISDRFGGGRVTFWTFAGMIVATFGVIPSCGLGSFAGFFACFMALFFLTGVGNASTFQMIPVIMGKRSAAPDAASGRHERKPADRDGIRRRSSAFTSAIAAYGAFFIPKAYGTSIAMTGQPVGALWVFLVFYVICLVITWAVYTRPGGLLHDIEHGRMPQGSAAQPAQ